MTLLDYLHSSTSTTQVPAAAEPAPELAVAPVAEVKEEGQAPAVEDIAATTVVEPLKDDVNKQPTLTHAEQGNAHVESEPVIAPADEITPAPLKPTEEVIDEAHAPVSTAEEAKEEKKEIKEEKKEEKKVATKEKVEKTKGEAKGFFAKFFGSKDKSPKKEKKVKTPKTEKTDPIVESAPVTETPAVAAVEPTEVVKAEEIKAEEPHIAEPVVTAPSPVVETATVVDVPAIVETAPEASTSASAVEPEAVKETEITPAPVASTETAAPVIESSEDKPVAGAEVPSSKEGSPKAGPKATRRLSARFTNWAKGFGKKEHGTTPKEEISQEAAEHRVDEEGTAAPSTAIATEAPQLEKPIEVEPLKIEEPTASTSAPHTNPVVSATA